MIISAIETEYANCRFRSRLEARWAVFFDRLGIRWQYEVDGYELASGSRYLPDFWLPDLNVYVEVKGSDDALAEDWQKITAFVQEANGIVLVLGEVPRIEHRVPVHLTVGMFDGEVHCLSSIFLHSPITKSWQLVRLLAELSPTTEMQFVDGLEVSQKVRNAYYAARSARFEHGETPEAPKQWTGESA